MSTWGITRHSLSTLIPPFNQFPKRCELSFLQISYNLLQIMMMLRRICIADAPYLIDDFIVIHHCSPWGGLYKKHGGEAHETTGDSSSSTQKDGLSESGLPTITPILRMTHIPIRYPVHSSNPVNPDSDNLYLIPPPYRPPANARERDGYCQEFAAFRGATLRGQACHPKPETRIPKPGGQYADQWPASSDRSTRLQSST